MLYKLLIWLDMEFGGLPGFGVVKYLSFRSAMAIIFSLIISLLIGRKLINYLRRKLIGESIRELGPEGHKKKAGTPTMGGLIIIAAMVIPTVLWADMSNIYVQLLLIATLWMGFIGFMDDYIKVFKKDKRGLQGKFKIVGQVGLGLIVGITMLFHQDFRGPMDRIGDHHEIKVNQTLADANFRPEDQLLAVKGVPYDSSHNYENDAPVNQYLVRRTIANSETSFSIEKVLVMVPAGMEQKVHDALFGPQYDGFRTQTNVPFLKNTVLDYSEIAFWDTSENKIWGKILYVLIVIFIVTAVSNGVNITDGLDGLAAGTSAIAASVMAIFAYVSGNVIFSDYLNISYIPMSSETVVFCAALIGGCVGFLWYNTHPAQVFMGDTGSLMLGGAIGVMALMVKKELLLPLICGVFFVESLSVIIQVSYFRYTKRKYGEGRRIFRMSPLHHHFELKGMHEAKITTRFWIIATMLSVLAFITLKLR